MSESTSVEATQEVVGTEVTVPSPPSRPWGDVIAPWRDQLVQHLSQVSLDDLVRALITFTLVGMYLWMQWNSPEKDNPSAYVVPGPLVSAAGIVTGFYLTSDASRGMKALLSLVYVGMFAAFMKRWGWVPESVNTQVTTALGIWFGRKVLEAFAHVPDVKTMTTEKRVMLLSDLQKPVATGAEGDSTL